MKSKTSQPNPWLALLTAIAGVLCIVVVPLITADAMDSILRGVQPKLLASGNPLLASAPKIVIGFFPVWNGLTVAAGIALLFVSWALYKGESWARPVAIGLLAIPAITGAYYSGPIMAFASSKMVYFIIVAAIGLIPYFTLLLSDGGSVGEKIGRFFLFLMLGVTTAWTFSNGGSSLRMFWARPEPIYILDPGNIGFLLGFPVAWIGVVVTLVSIALLAARMRLGFRLAMVGLVIILFGNLFLFINHTGTREFMVGIIMAVVTLTLLALPAVGGRMVAEPAKHPSTQQPAIPAVS
jgi:hypothetical protein